MKSISLGQSLFAALIAMSLSSCLPSHRVDEIIPEGSPPMLHPGDSVKVAVWRNPELSGGFLVADDGTLQHPLYRAVQVARIPLDSVVSRIGTFLLEYSTSPQYVVQPMFRIVVAGEVRSPAMYVVPVQTTLGAAIAFAGGPTENAQIRKVTLVREQHVYRLDLSDPAAAWIATPIRSGDEIIIGRKSNLFFGAILPLFTASAAVASLISVLRRN